MLREIAAGLVIGLIVFGWLTACLGGSLPPLVRCKLEALKVLPEDENMITVGDARDVYRRIRACHQQQTDGGP